jgi:hypothetical protein
MTLEGWLVVEIPATLVIALLDACTGGRAT